jgi:hypothetical protein
MTVATAVTRTLAIATTVRPLPTVVSASTFPNPENNLFARFIDDSSDLDGDYQATVKVLGHQAKSHGLRTNSTFFTRD